MTDEVAPALAEALHDRYRVERELGRGGMATVYLARDVKHDRVVALKVLRPELSAILGPDRFLQEIRVTAGLQHPHILPLLDSGAAGGLLFYVMPYVEGESLRQRLEREGQLPLDEALRITSAVASALEYAHEQGIIHRDIKPENILLYRGEAMVADFGIALAAATAGRERLTETGLSLGTPAYMSPEQASADPKLDGRSDQYSLACVVYEMLAGEPPYTGRSAQAIIAKRLSEPVPHVSTVRTVPKMVELAVTRALAKAPADRFSTVAAFTAALERTAPRPRMSRRLAALAGGLAGLAVMLLLAWLLRPGAEARPAVSRQFTFTGRANDPALSPDGQSLAYVSANQSLTVQRLGSGDPVVLVPPSRWVFNPRWTSDGSAILFCMMPDSSRLAATWMIPSVGGAPHEVIQDIDAFDAGSDSTTALVSQREHHRIVVMDLRNQRVRHSLPIADSLGVVQDLDWSPDERWIAFEAQGIWITSLAGGAVQLSRSGRLPRWSASGDAVYFLDGPRGSTALKRVRVDARSGKPRETPAQVLGIPTADRFSIGPKGVLVHTQVTLSSQALALRYGRRGPQRKVQESRALTEGTGWVNSLSISDDGRQMAVSRAQGDESAIVVLPFEGGPGRVVAGSPLEELAPVWSPDGTKLAFLRSDSVTTRLMTVTYPDGTPQRLGSAEPVAGAFVPGLSWSGDGRWLSYRAADLRRIGLLDVDRQQESFIAIPDSLGYGYSGGAFLSPDGRHIVISTIHRWNDWGRLWLATSDGRILRRLNEPFGESYPIRWTRDGWLYVVNTRAQFTDGGTALIYLWRIRMPDGAPEFFAPVPEGCGSLSLSRDATRATCDFNTRQSDLVEVTGFDPEAR